MIRRALTNTGWLMGARTINGVLSLVYLALATRSLGLEDFGQFVICTTFGPVLAALVSFQTWQVVVHWGQDKDVLPDAVGFAIALDLLSIAAGTIIGAALLGLGGDWLPINDELRLPTFLFLLSFLVSIRLTPTGILRLHDHYGRAATADAMTSIVRVAGAGLVVLVQPSIAGFLMVWAMAEIVTAIAYWIMAARTQPLYVRHTSLLRIPRAQEKAWQFVIGTSLSGMLTVASRQFLVLLVGVFGGAAMAGIYRVAAQIGEGLLKLAQALLRAVYPEMARAPDEARMLAGRIARIGIATGVVAVGVSALAGEWVIKAVASKEFLAAYIPMIVLSAAAALELSGASMEALLVARGRAMLNFALRAIPTALALLALPWLVDWLGATGAALAVMAASAATVAGFVIANRREKQS